MIRKLLLCAMAVVVMGCSGNDQDAAEEAPEGTVFDPQIQALDKAKGVNQQIEDAAAQQRRAIDDQGG